MNLCVFDIPHLNDGVTQHLSLQDLARCVLVCKAWHSWFTPTLWCTVRFWQASPEGISALTRFHSHVRTLDIHFADLVLPPGVLTPFPNIRSVRYRSSQGTNDHQLLQLIRATPSLQSIAVCIERGSGDISARLANTLRSLPWLRKLDLTWNGTTPDDVQRIIENCSQYDSLRLDLYMSSYTKEEAREKCQIAKTAMDQMENTRIRELTLERPEKDVEFAVLIPLLERCPLLERLKLEDLGRPETVRKIAAVLRNKKCPRLKHLDIGISSGLDGDEEPIAELLRSIECSSDRGEHGGIQGGQNGGDAGGNHGGGLETLSVNYGVYFEEKCLLALTAYHGETLVALDLSFRTVELHHFVGAVSCLPKLQSLRICVSLGLRILDVPTIEQAFQTPWTCLSLTALEIMLDVDGYHAVGIDSPKWKESLQNRFLEYMYSQFGRLRELREWKLRGRFDSLPLQQGYLIRLAGLKQLKSMSLRFDECYEVGAIEAEWMTDNWPGLIHVVTRRNIPRRGGNDTDPFELNVFTSALRAKRPWIQIEEIR